MHVTMLQNQAFRISLCTNIISELLNKCHRWVLHTLLNRSSLCCDRRRRNSELANFGIPSNIHRYPDNKFYGANMGPIWVRQDPGGPYVCPMNFVIWVVISDKWNAEYNIHDTLVCRPREYHRTGRAFSSTRSEATTKRVWGFHIPKTIGNLHTFAVTTYLDFCDSIIQEVSHSIYYFVGIFCLSCLDCIYQICSQSWKCYGYRFLALVNFLII